MSQRIADIEGIGPAMSEKLAQAGIGTIRNLLERGATPKGRSEIARLSGIDEKRVLKWVNMADLFKVNGIGSEYSELLEAAGVDTVKELGTRNADNLFARISEVNTHKKLVRKTPTLEQIRDFIKQAENPPPVVTY